MLNMVSTSIQWRCCVCNAAESVGTGGICVRCKKFVCNRHLNIVLADEKNIRVCSSCLTGEDRVEKRLRGMLRRWFS
jgi:hypothetical protein